MMKSVNEMTADEMEAARTANTPRFGTTMYRRTEDGYIIYSDVEDYCPTALLATIADMRRRGWREVTTGNRYAAAGMLPVRP